jgi:hypothetical protein
MTERQKIRYISSYLSCDVDFYLAGNIRPFEKLEVHNLSQVLRNEYPLVLRPISDLSDEYVSQYLLDCLKNSSSKDIKEALSYNSATYLLELHFDIYGLIENDLAIDINRL